MKKNIIPILIVGFVFTASTIYFGTDFRSPIPDKEVEKSADVQELEFKSISSVEDFLKDKDNRINDTFSISPYYYPNVRFWFMIYTHFESSQVLIHDKNDLNIIYKILDFSSLHKKNVPKNTLYILQQKLSSEKMESLKGDLDLLTHNPFSTSTASKTIFTVLKNAGVEPPENKKSRIAFFKNLRDNLRTQTGQRNFIRDGILRSLPYQSFLTQYFEKKGLPKELLAVPFLESSFNPKAHSKVNALGIWQFMPHIGKHFMPNQKQFDYRSNVGVSSVAAAFLLSENFKILKSWDLAITAYNSGTKHLLKSKRKLASEDVNLERIIKTSDSQHFGFASKNFYSEFLALVHTRAYQEEIYKDLHEHDREDVNKSLRFFIAKCPLKFKGLFHGDLLDDVQFHNHHITDFAKNYPKGTILTTKSQLPKSSFHEIAFSDKLINKPKTWDKFVARQSCSTR